MTTKDQLFQTYLEAKAEFERIAHSETVLSDEYEAARERAKIALKNYQDSKPPAALTEAGQPQSVRPGIPDL
jgi:urate oxidase